jgi:hypothetical protein
MNYQVGDLLRRGGNIWDKQITFGLIIEQKAKNVYVIEWYNKNLIEKQTLIKFELEELLSSTLWNWKHYPVKKENK